MDTVVERKIKTELVILGGGPGGIAAALAATEHGVDCVLIERYGQLGGQIMAVHRGYPINRFLDPEVFQINQLIPKLLVKKVKVITGAALWGVETSRMVHLFQETRNIEVEFEQMLVATGAYERPMPFSGWTLPGVITAGAAQRLSKVGVAPGNRILVAGRGVLLLRCAAELVKAGFNVVSMIEATSFARLFWTGLKKLNNLGSKLAQALEYQSVLLKAGVPILYGHAVIEALGKGTVEQAITEQLDGDGTMNPTEKCTWLVDSICISNGLEPDNRVCRMLNCDLVYDPATETFIPRHDKAMRTSIPWVYVAGEAAGLGGAGKALIEGEIVGTNAAITLGKANAGRLAPHLEWLARQHRRLLHQSWATESLYLPASRLLGITKPNTVICRCEEITRQTLRSAIEEDNSTLRDIKNRTRIGMGLCQGRMCETMLHYQYNAITGNSVDPAQMLRIRPPLEPTPLGILSQDMLD